MNQKGKKVVCFGEVLMDIFPNEKKIGGAPLNVATWLSKFGENVSMISAVGNDENARELINYMQQNGINIDLVQQTPQFPTGTVLVHLDVDGSATYTIPHPSAWDNIVINDDMIERVKQSDAFIYSSLPARDANNFEVISKLLKSSNYNVLDVNLRPPHYTKKVIYAFCEAADLIKLNEVELLEITKMYGSISEDIHSNILFLKNQTNTDSICVTLGEKGAILYLDGQFTTFDGIPTQVIDTVGAGDSFLAALISQLLNKETPSNALKFACSVGSFVASHRGANPSISNGELHAYLNQK